MWIRRPNASRAASIGSGPPTPVAPPAPDPLPALAPIGDGRVVYTAPGERLVTRGAYYVRLAATGGAVPSHGHAH